MKIKDKLSQHPKAAPFSLSPDETVATAVTKMSEKNYGAVVIASAENTVLGIVSERDFMKRVLNEKRDPATTKLSEIMTAPVKTAALEDSWIDWMRIMSNERFRHLPVVDQHNRLVGIMSQGDFVAYTWPDMFNQIKENAKSRLAVWFQIIFALLAILVLASLAG